MILQRVITFFFLILLSILKKITMEAEQEIECSQYKCECNRTLIRWLFEITNIVCYIYTISMIGGLKFRGNNYAEPIKSRWTIYHWIHRQVLDILPLNDYIRDRSSSPSEELMKHEWARFESFNTYPDSSPYFPLKLAKAGFYYTGKGIYIKCFCCGLRLDFWPTHETIDEAHWRLSPNCRFLRGESNNNPIQYPHDHAQQNAGSGRRHVGDRLRTFERILNGKRMLNAGSPDVIESLRTGDFIVCSLDEHARWFSDCESARIDFNSDAAQRVLGMGYSEQRVKEAIREFRKKYGMKELSAKELLDCIMDTEPNLVTANTSDAQTTHTVRFGVFRVIPNLPLTIDDDPMLVRFNFLEYPLRSLRIHEHLAMHDSTGNGQGATEQQERKMCKICMEKEVCIRFIPCCHEISCDDCACALRKCDVCKTEIRDKIRIL